MNEDTKKAADLVKLDDEGNPINPDAPTTEATTTPKLTDISKAKPAKPAKKVALKLLNPHVDDLEAVVMPFMTSGTSKEKKYFHFTADPVAGFKATGVINVARVTADLVAIMVAPRIGAQNLSALRDGADLSEVKSELLTYLSMDAEDPRILDISKPFRVFLKPVYIGITAGLKDTDKFRAALEDGTIALNVAQAFSEHCQLPVNTSDEAFLNALTQLISARSMQAFPKLHDGEISAKDFAIHFSADEFNILDMTALGSKVGAKKKEAANAVAAMLAKKKKLEAPMMPPAEDATPDAPTLGTDIEIDGGGEVSDDDDVGGEGSGSDPTQH